MAKFNKCDLRRAALSSFGEPNGITWHEVTALMDFFEAVRSASDMVETSRERLKGVLDYMHLSSTINDEQYTTLTKLANEIE